MAAPRTAETRGTVSEDTSEAAIWPWLGLLRRAVADRGRVDDGRAFRAMLPLPVRTVDVFSPPPYLGFYSAVETQ